MRLIIFGLDAAIEPYIDEINWNQVVACVDLQGQRKGKVLRITGRRGTCQCPICRPEELKASMADYFIIPSDALFWQASSYLIGTVHAAKEQIIGIDAYCRQQASSFFFLPKMEKTISRILQEFSLGCLLDADAFFAASPRFTRHNLFLGDLQRTIIDVVKPADGQTLPPFTANLYRRVVAPGENASGEWQAILYTKLRNLPACQEILTSSAYAAARYLILRLPWNIQEAAARLTLPETPGHHACWLPDKDSCWLILDRRVLPATGQLKIYVVTHKAVSFFPKDPIYQPIQAGRALHAPIDGCIGDDTGASLSALNPYINECTALYWIWQHSSAAVVGLVHYRRYFLRNQLLLIDNLIDEETVQRKLAEYDILVAEETLEYYPRLVRQVIQYDIGLKFYQAAEKILFALLAERQPAYVAACHQVLDGYGFFRCQMFIARRDILDRYCTWLFSFLPDLARRLDLQGANAKQQRTAGYFAERMLTVWLHQQTLRICEMPMLELMPAAKH